MKNLPKGESSVNDRWNYLVYDLLKSSPTKLADKMGVDAGTIRNIAGSKDGSQPYRNTKPSYLVSTKLINNFPNIFFVPLEKN